MKCGWRSQQCITPKTAIQPILGNRKERIQASGLGHTKSMPLKNFLQEGHHLSSRKTSAQPHSASPAAPGAAPGCSWTEACADDSHRGALRALQELGGAGPPPGVSEMAPVVWGLQAWICLRVPCGKGRKVGNGLEFGLLKKMSSTIVPCKCTHNSKLEE